MTTPLVSGRYRAEKASLAGSEFVNTNLEGAKFHDVSLRGADFSDVTLAGAKIANACLADVSITDADCTGMRIDGILVADLLRAYRRLAGPQPGASQRGFIHHLDLTVTDPAASCAFYDAVLGRLGYARSTEYAGDVPCWVLSRAGSTLSIGLHEAKIPTAHDRRAAGLHHLAFHLASRSEVDEFHGFLVREGIAVLDAPAEYDYTPGYYAVFFADPDGVKLELVHEPRLDPAAA